MMLIQTLGGTSGAHFSNLGGQRSAWASVQEISPAAAGGYIVMQLIGAIAGAALCKVILSELFLGPNLGNPSVSHLLAGKTLLGALCELVGTFALVWSIMGVAVNPRGTRDWAGFVIGATLGFALLTFGLLTGAGLNPARAGPAIGGATSPEASGTSGVVQHHRTDRRRPDRGARLQAAGADPRSAWASGQSTSSHRNAPKAA